MTGLVQPDQLLGVAWQLPAVLVAGWLTLLALRRRIPPWYFVVATAACSTVPLIAFLGAMLVGRAAKPEQGAGGVGFGAGTDIQLWSFLSVFTGLGSVIVLLFLTGIVELVRLWLLPLARPTEMLPAAASRRQGHRATLRFHFRRAVKSEMSHLNPQETHFAMRPQLLKPVAVEKGEGPVGGATGHE